MRDEIGLKSFPLTIESTGDGSENDVGTFTGYGSVFNNVDYDGEIVDPHAFDESLDEAKAKGRKFPVLYQHRTGNHIGHWDSLEPNTKGLYGQGKLWLGESDSARIAYRGMKERTISGLSIGYRVKEAKKDQQTGARRLTKLDLNEVSVVDDPANDLARIATVKRRADESKWSMFAEWVEKIGRGEEVSPREIEAILREAGAAKSVAIKLASGLHAKLRSESEDDEAKNRETAQALAELTQWRASLTAA